MTFSRDSLFGQFYLIASQFFEVLRSTMSWLFFEPLIPIQTWYWDVYSAVSGTWYEPYFKPIYQYLAWASGSPNVYGDEISLGVFILTAGASIWVLVKVVVFVAELVINLIGALANLKPVG